MLHCFLVMDFQKQKISQSQLGDRVDMRRTDVNMTLNDIDRPVSFQRLVEMANALGLKVDVKITKGNV